MAGPYNSTVTFDGNVFDAVEIAVMLATTTDRNGMPTMGSFQAKVRLVLDPSDQQNMPFSVVQKLFGYANVTTADKIKAVKLEYWTDDSKQNALCCYKFNGWISSFQTLNPVGNGDIRHETQQGQTNTLNNMMVLEITPQLNTSNQPNFVFSN
jgi:hypothetical protein